MPYGCDMSHLDICFGHSKMSHSDKPCGYDQSDANLTNHNAALSSSVNHSMVHNQ